jgi:cyclohexanone monooxygenase
MINFNSCINGEPVEEDLVNDGWTQDVLMAIPNEDGDFASYLEKLRLADFRKMEGIRARVDEVVKDKKTAEQLKPWYGSICKRPCFHDGYLNCFNQPNCILIDTDGKGPERISEKGIVINGQEYEVDLIIYSTGFWAPGSRPQPYGIVINGANGISLAEKWRDGTSTYLGIQSNGFPNWYNISLIQSGGSMNITFMLDTAAQHIAYVISECEKRGIRSIEPTVKAEEEWVNDIVEAAMMRRGFIANCTPSYYNHEGHLDDVSPKESPYFAGANAWYNILEEWRAHGNMEGMQKTLRYGFSSCSIYWEEHGLIVNIEQNFAFTGSL